MKKPRLWHTAHGRLLLLAIGLEFLMLTLLVGNSLRLFHQAMSDQVQAQAQEISPVLIAALTAPLAQRDYATIQAILDESTVTDSLNYIVVVDRHGNRLTTDGFSAERPLPEASRTFSSSLLLTEGIYHVARHITYLQQPLGDLHFGLNLTRILTARKTLLIQGAGIAVVEIILSSLVLLLLGLWLARHMRSLTRASLEVADGNFSLQPLPEGEDDIGQLGRAFNLMSQAIQDRVNELTKAKEIAEASEIRLRTLTDSANDAIVMMNSQDVISYWNPAAERILGYPAEEALGQNIYRLLVPERYRTASERAVAKLTHGGRGKIVGRTYELFARKKDGSEFPISLSLSAVSLNSEWHALSIIRDISDIRKADELLAQKQHLLEQLNQSLQLRVKETVAELRSKDQMLISQGRQAAMGEMIGNIAHQWRQPLNTLSLLLTNIHYAHENDELTNEYMAECIATGNRLIQKMSSTINDFRDFFRPNKVKQPFSAKRQIRLAIEMVAESFVHCRIEITLEIDQDCTLFGFPNEYSQVLLNLLNNARDAITGAKQEQGRIQVTLGVRQGQGVVSVQDNGGGIPEHVLDKIFEPYFSTKPMGTGIGLYMSKMIIEHNMQGRIEARNIVGGSELSVSVPLAEQAS